jgi:iron complex outermembrane receptor protein
VLTKVRRELLCGVAALLIVPGVRTAQAAVSATAAAQSTVTADTLEEVVVTAQRRQENLQEVPITVEAVGADVLVAVGARNITDLVNVVPGLTIPTSAGYSLPHLRGIGITAIGAGIENSVALYVDGIYRGVSSSSAVALNNIAQVEVEKGPQGTLFGRNATGGLIQVTTWDPKPGFSGSANLGYANYNTVSGDLYLTGGTDVLAGDIAVQVTHQGKGWGTNLFSGQDVNRVERNLSLRSKWLFNPTDTTKVRLIVDAVQTRNSNSALRNYQNVPNAFYPGGFADLATLNVNENGQLLRRMQESGESIQLDQDVGFAHLVNTLAYRQDTYSYNVDFDLGPSPYSLNDTHQADRQLSEELQLISSAASALTWMTGLYYYNAGNAFSPQNIYFSGLGITPPLRLTQVANQSEQKTDSLAVYGQATQALASKTKLTLGFRYTNEMRGIVGVQKGYPVNVIVPITLANVDNSVRTHTPTWRIALSHDFSDDVHGYASYNRGFKSGGYNVTAPAVPAYQPEKLDAYEIGLKTQLLDRRLTLNTAVFYYNYSNIQVSRFLNGSPQVYNGGKARLYGLDADVTMRVTNYLSVTAGIELERDKFTDFPKADFFLSCPVSYPTVCSLSADGKQLPQTPTASGTININYRVPLEQGEVNFNLNEAANSGYYYAPNNEYRQSGYGLLNGSVAWSVHNYSVTLWGKNLTNVIYPISVNQAPTAVAAAYAAPRTYGVTLGAKL